MSEINNSISWSYFAKDYTFNFLTILLLPNLNIHFIEKATHERTRLRDRGAVHRAAELRCGRRAVQAQEHPLRQLPGDLWEDICHVPIVLRRDAIAREDEGAREEHLSRVIQKFLKKICRSHKRYFDISGWLHNRTKSK